VEDDKAEQLSIRALLEHDDIEIEVAESVRGRWQASGNAIDCMVLDLRLPIFRASRFSTNQPG